MKSITKTCKSTQVKVIGINPDDFTQVKTVDYLYNGDFATATPKDIENIKKAVSAAVIPAQVISTNNFIETKYALTIDEFIKLSHAYIEGEKLVDCITRTITTYRLCVYGLNINALDKVETHEITYHGDYTKITRSERDKFIQTSCLEYTVKGFCPAYIKILSTSDEKRVITISDFIKNAHIATDEDNED